MPKQFALSALVLLIFMLLSEDIKAQQKANFRTVDTLTYQQYLDGEWDALVKTGKAAIQQDVDYYYLRMRMGWAFFSQQKYRLAIKHYEKALEFNSTDPVALELLIKSYVFSGRKNDAIKLSEKLHYKKNNEMYSRFNNDVTGFSAFITLSSAQSKQAVEDINNHASDLPPGIQKVTRSDVYPLLGLSHKSGRGSLIMNHTLGFLSRKEYSLVINDQGLFPLDEQPVTQLDYQLSADIIPLSGLQVAPAFFWSYTRIPVYEVGYYGFGRTPPLRAFDYIHEYNTFYSLSTKYEWGLFSAGISAGTGKINFFQSHQAGLHFKYFPLANLDLYYAGNFYYQLRQDGSDQEGAFIHQHKTGFKLTDLLWVELETHHGNIIGFHDADNRILYNSLDIISQSYLARGIIPLKDNRLKLILNFRYTDLVSGFYSDDNTLDIGNKINYNNIHFTGGLQWSL